GAQLVAGRDHDRQWVVGRLEVVQAPHPQPACGDGGLVERVVLEHQDAVEQVHRSGDLAPALQFGQGDVVEATRLGLLRLYRAQPVERRLSTRDGDAAGHGVDEHADHRLDAGQVGGATGHRGTEDDVTLAAVVREREAPRALHDGVDGQPVALYGVPQPAPG